VRFVDTESFAADGVDLLSPEVAFVYRPFSLQSEYTRVFVNAAEAGDPNFCGFYVMGSHFLSGEQRRYDGEEG
jgi:phosphate-selective porin